MVVELKAPMEPLRDVAYLMNYRNMLVLKPTDPTDWFGGYFKSREPLVRLIAMGLNRGA